MSTNLFEFTMNPGERRTVLVPVGCDIYALVGDGGTGLMSVIGGDGIPTPGRTEAIDYDWTMGPFDVPTIVALTIFTANPIAQCAIRVNDNNKLYESINAVSLYYSQYADALNFVIGGPINKKLGIFASAGAPPDNYQNGNAEKGSLCMDYTNGKLYVNGGTLSATVWKLVTSAA